MIHSLCGGKLKEGEEHVFAKVSFDKKQPDGRGFGWYLADGFSVKNGDKVTVIVKYFEEEGTVEQVVVCKNGVTPVPLRTAKEIISVRV